MSQAVRVGVVGGGRVGVSFARFLRSQTADASLVGIVTSTPERQKELSQQFEVPAYATVEQMMGSATPPQMVAVVNANEDHAPATIAALKCGAHVFCEKPMAPTLAECRAMVEAERQSGRSLQIGFEYMHGTMTQRLRQLVAEGFFGQLLSLSVVDSRGHWASDPPSTPISKIWKLDRKRGGGIVFHCGIHQLDMIRCLLGPVEQVTAYRAPKNALSFYPADVPDHLTLMLKAASGAVCNFQIYHNRAPCFYRQSYAWSPDWRTVPGHQFDLSLVGTRGSCLVQIYQEKMALFRFDLEQRDTVLERVEDFSPNHPNASHHDMHALLLAYIRNIAAGEGAVDPASGALQTMVLAFAAEHALDVPGQLVQTSQFQ